MSATFQQSIKISIMNMGFLFFFWEKVMYMVIDNPNQVPDLSKSVVCIFMLQTTPLFLFMMVLATRVSHTSSI